VNAIDKERHLTEVEQASRSTPDQWQSWGRVCVGGEAVFLPLVVTDSGRRSQRQAGNDVQEHEAGVTVEAAELAESWHNLQ
jgi:hypothetical protein